MWLALAAMAAILGAADGHQVGSTMAQAPHSPYATQQHKRYVSTYKNFMSDNNFIKKHEVVHRHGLGHPKYMDIITVNVTSLSEGARAWLCSQTADIILVQEHHCLTRKEFGQIL